MEGVIEDERTMVDVANCLIHLLLKSIEMEDSVASITYYVRYTIHLCEKTLKNCMILFVAYKCYS